MEVEPLLEELSRSPDLSPFGGIVEPLLSPFALGSSGPASQK